VTITFQTLDKELEKVPPLPATVSDVLTALQQDDVDLGTVERNINRDPALTARVLRVANSSFYGFSGQVDNIKDACVILGVYTTRNIVLAAGIIKHLTAGAFGGLDLSGLWQHAIGTGAAAKVLAKPAGVNPETAFTAGLLHDLGKFILAIYFSDSYDAVIRHRDREDSLLRDAETDVLGFDHALVGAKVARVWSLPDSIVNAIEYHHLTATGEARRLANLVQVADIVCRGLELGDAGDTLIPLLDACVLQHLNLTIPLLEESLAGIEQVLCSCSSLIE
jgi:putative nucleotidyltransferase with HDIG domain